MRKRMFYTVHVYGTLKTVYMRLYRETQTNAPSIRKIYKVSCIPYTYKYSQRLANGIEASWTCPAPSGSLHSPDGQCRSLA